jgi:hypothetical protein
MAAKAADYTNFDPIEDIRKDIEKAADLPNLDAPAATEPAHAEAASASLPPPAPAESSAEAAAVTPSESPSAATSEIDGIGKPDAGKAA